jgi:hypothetical protein
VPIAAKVDATFVRAVRLPSILSYRAGKPSDATPGGKAEKFSGPRMYAVT